MLDDDRFVFSLRRDDPSSIVCLCFKLSPERDEDWTKVDLSLSECVYSPYGIAISASSQTVEEVRERPDVLAVEKPLRGS
ncbi:MAG: hypothetical protein WCD86_24900 [Ktedonobacteraceae bacterium]